ncbi:MAG: hypothetical protein AAFR87_10700 [Bacteroidota bacterium]
MKKSLIIFLFIILSLSQTFAQQKELTYSHKWSLVFGMTQPLLLDGFNFAVNYTTNRWVFEYSHGVSLNYEGPALRSAYEGQIISLESPYSTGPGVGYRFFSNDILGLDVRAEAKLHQYNVQLNQTQSIKYRNFDLGGGVYLQIRPFGKSTKAIKGIVIEPSIRYWANVSSSLEDNFTYLNPEGMSSTHNPYPLDLFANISIGYTFGN